MRISKVSTPEIYRDSSDFRFFLNWFEKCLRRIQYDTEHLSDLYDPLRCPKELLWMLGDTVGFKYDDRLPAAYNRLILIYFMSLIRNKGSKDGLTLAGELNLAQFNILNYGKESDILYNRLEDTSIPVNSVYVNCASVDQGYIDIVYFSTDTPVDACIEYVRPLGMYVFQCAGVRFDARTKISIDTRLANSRDVGISVGPTHVGHYSRNDYARMQRMDLTSKGVLKDTRDYVYYRNIDYEVNPDPLINPGYRSLSSLQLCNSDHMVTSLIDSHVFGLGYTPNDVSTYTGIGVLEDVEDFPKSWNLRYDENAEIEETDNVNVYTVEDASTELKPVPKVNRIMNYVGDAIHIDDSYNYYSKVTVEEGEPVISVVEDE